MGGEERRGKGEEDSERVSLSRLFFPNNEIIAKLVALVYD